VSQAFTDDYKGVWLVRRDVYFSRVTGEPPGVGAPAGTPADVIDKLNKEINAGLADAKQRIKTTPPSAPPPPRGNALREGAVRRQPSLQQRLLQRAP
jgi:tripartite-type tricarboxylate transporter receptor subunit TctC